MVYFLTRKMEFDGELTEFMAKLFQYAMEELDRNGYA